MGTGRLGFGGTVVVKCCSDTVQAVINVDRYNLSALEKDLNTLHIYVCVL